MITFLTHIAHNRTLTTMTNPDKKHPERRTLSWLQELRQHQQLPLPLHNKKPPRKAAVSMEDNINQPMMEGQCKRKVQEVKAVSEKSIQETEEDKTSNNNKEVRENKSKEKVEETSEEVQKEKKKQANEMNNADNEVIVEEAPPVASIPTT